MKAKQRIKLKATALADQVQAEQDQLARLATALAQWVGVVLAMQQDIGRAQERVAEQQRQLNQLIAECDSDE